jgi:hypothetical protein
MKRKRHTEEQIIAILKEHEAGVKTADMCRKHGISDGIVRQIDDLGWAQADVGNDVQNKPCIFIQSRQRSFRDRRFWMKSSRT